MGWLDKLLGRKKPDTSQQTGGDAGGMEEQSHEHEHGDGGHTHEADEAEEMHSGGAEGGGTTGR